MHVCGDTVKLTSLCKKETKANRARLEQMAPKMRESPPVPREKFILETVKPAQIGHI